ncbi:NAD(P)H-dependent oxidoreductase [Utexia brackfieldae]|uniref:NAD(P)H-dependent oxidoreductase n=1 Tax=Utexia brackfieldae TaxID=3074108 RepID=UPI00370D0BB9
MKPTIIFTHPWPDSYNQAILDALVAQYQERSIEYQLIDLHQDNFNPVLSCHDLSLYAAGQSSDPLVIRYQGYLRQTRELIIIGPIWWYELPAIFKGFLDKVLLAAFAFVDGDKGIIGQLSHIEKTTIITTSGSDTAVIGNYIQDVLIDRTLAILGLKQIMHVNLGNIDKISQAERQAFIEEVKQHLS